ncbi:unnamed protein product [Moneuplotes crassus]|uniref:Uncharacterized protein n=1 Tax=Euplotes crassus TaxID=5936 RepID=A0AAD1Y114_EUPCR|nr:unnamed protein product [Moneuplotes crassus]
MTQHKQENLAIRTIRCLDKYFCKLRRRRNEPRPKLRLRRDSQGNLLSNILPRLSAYPKLHPINPPAKPINPPQTPKKRLQKAFSKTQNPFLPPSLPSPTPDPLSTKSTKSSKPRTPSQKSTPDFPHLNPFHPLAPADSPTFQRYSKYPLHPVHPPPVPHLRLVPIPSTTRITQSPKSLREFPIFPTKKILSDPKSLLSKHKISRTEEDDNDSDSDLVRDTVKGANQDVEDLVKSLRWAKGLEKVYPEGKIQEELGGKYWDMGWRDRYVKEKAKEYGRRRGERRV